MTREQAKELLPVIQAFAEGKAIQCSNDGGKTWFDIDLPEWHESVSYRIKPEAKYRPFANKEECWQEMQNHQPFGWLKDKRVGNFINLSYVANNKDFKELFKDSTFADGTPFGINEEEQQ